MTDKITIYDKKPVDKLTFADDGMFQEVPGKRSPGHYRRKDFHFQSGKSKFYIYSRILKNDGARYPCMTTAFC